MKLEITGDRLYGFGGHGESDGEYLEPCPFCGGTNIVVENTHTPSYSGRCEDCGCEGPSGRATNTDRAKVKGVAERRHREAFAAAVTLWNRRSA